MDPNLLLLVVFVVLIGWMFFNSRRTRAKQKEAAELKAQQMVPGARVMTRSGLFGTLVEFDKDDLSKPAKVEIAPGVVIELHSQVVDIAPDTVVEDDAAEADDVDEEPVTEVEAAKASEEAAEAPAVAADGKPEAYGVPEYKLPEIDLGDDKGDDKKA
ncbi:preprotein translocase subunit YajC [Microbacterium stercoris]|uniref:Preprotein translocase subunit YajC n=1 Tax=Microbacterium stercoris TaxID=2820289 RepID=A0A939TNS6_9MICO|nr:preprotein translocase subunit YajC [Microbacterium stercoris]MBO3664278.1 preprotein translocase subunit YajC [Microbacterium stercoris]MBO3664543.1 preprotein translocase subunit YajC [Microbacterium stercoris]